MVNDENGKDDLSNIKGYRSLQMQVLGFPENAFRASPIVGPLIECTQHVLI